MKFLLILVALSAVLPGPVYRTAFWLQAAGYLVGLAGMWRPVGARLRVASAAASLLVLNAAAWQGFWVWLAGRDAARRRHGDAFDLKAFHTAALRMGGMGLDPLAEQLALL